MKITASLVTYQNPEPQLRELLQSLDHSQLQVRLIVIDNSPTQALAPLFKDHEYHWTGNNLGFGKAHNLAVTQAGDSEIHLILNPDIYFPSDTIEKIDAFMQEQPDITCCVPRVLYPDNRLQRLCKLLPTPLNLFARRFCPWLAEHLDHDYEMRAFDYQTTIEIPSASGCFMAVRTEIFRKIGGFDTRFFMYLEDVDLSRRLAEVGRLVFFHQVTIYHRHAKSSYKNHKLMLTHMLSACRYFNKWGWWFDRKRRLANNKIKIEHLRIGTPEK